MEIRPGVKSRARFMGMEMAIRILALAMIVLVSGGMGLSPAWAMTSPSPRHPMVTASLLAHDKAIVPGQPFWLGVLQKIPPGWHTYWRNPGDSGEPSTIIWDLPHGFHASEIHWPYPEAIPYGPLTNYGYSDEVMLLSRITPPKGLEPGREITLKALATWLVCDDICIPEEQTLAITMPVVSAEAAEKDNLSVFTKYFGKLPEDKVWDARWTVSNGRLRLKVTVPEWTFDDTMQIRFFGHEWGVEKPSAQQVVTRMPDGFGIETEWGGAAQEEMETITGVVVFGAPPLPGTDKQAYFVQARKQIRDESFVVDADMASAGSSPGNGKTASRLTLATALIFAFLGGVILNLMPCVFPVLSVKALGLVTHNQDDRRVIRRHGWFYTLGVLTCFAVISLVLMLLRSAGDQIGWGFQLQSPAFVSMLAYLFFTVGLNLSGMFEISGRLSGIGNGWTSTPGDRGAFFTGMLATVVATPCTAPLMAAAIGFALMQAPPVGVLVFLALGLGLAVPYLLLCHSPAVLKWLPQPGPWMETIRQFLAFPMYLSAAWLVWVLARQTNGNGVLYTLAGMVLIGMAVWLYGLAHDKRDEKSNARIGMALVAAIVALILGALSGHAGHSKAVAFSAARLEHLLAEGRPVFVNMTADWCITCKANEQMSLSNRMVEAEFANRGIVYMRGDWTKRDAEITRYLQHFGRDGVPLYVYYPAGDAQPVVLPQILTPALVIDYLEKNGPKES